MTVTLITGASTGIGRATALTLAQKGHDVYATMRNPSKATKLVALAGEAGVNVNVVALDVADDESVRSGVSEVLERAGQIDVLINNAGIAYNATVEDIDLVRAHEVFEANYFGVIRCTQAVVPQMRERGSGHIINISSIAGRVTAIAQAVYTSSKFAVEALSEHMAQELTPFGIKVTIVEPGITMTPMLAKNADIPEGSIYEAPYRREFQFYAAGVGARPGPELVTDTIWEVLTTDSPRLRYLCAWGAEQLVNGRAKLTDEAWIAMCAAESDETYFDAFSNAFGLELRGFTPTAPQTTPRRT